MPPEQSSDPPSMALSNKGLEELEEAAKTLSLDKDGWADPTPEMKGDSKGEEERAHDTVPEGETEKQRKKRLKREYYKSKKSKSQVPKATSKPTGFEEGFVDAPMTPDEHGYEKEIYSKSQPAIIRIQEALSRYQQKRRIHTDRMQVFTRWLLYGGVDVGPKQFAGVTEQELREMDKENIISARSQTGIGIEKLHMKIDFDLVVKGFLTSYFPDYFNPDGEEMIQLATATIKNFLNYLIYHDVVPEYRDNVNEARRTCDLATKQLWDNQRFMTKGPGDFNKASSILHGGYHHDPEANIGQWDHQERSSPRMNHEIAHKVFKFALACSGTDEQASNYTKLAEAGALQAERVEDIDGFEVTEVTMPETELRHFYDKYAPDLRVVGRLRGKVYRDPCGPPIDLAPGETLGDEQTEFEFLVEEDLLRFCYPGMKVITAVWELNCGVYYFDQIMSAYCSFYTVLVNDLMIGWKQPRDKGDDDDEKIMEKNDAPELENVKKENEDAG